MPRAMTFLPQSACRVGGACVATAALSGRCDSWAGTTSIARYVSPGGDRVPLRAALAEIVGGTRTSRQSAGELRRVPTQILSAAFLPPG